MKCQNNKAGYNEKYQLKNKIVMKLAVATS